MVSQLVSLHYKRLTIKHILHLTHTYLRDGERCVLRLYSLDRDLDLERLRSILIMNNI
jgi:hypothetical protein